MGDRDCRPDDGASAAGCGCDPGRRAFLKAAGLGAAAVSFGMPGFFRIDEATGAVIRVQHRVPADKKLSAAWRKALFLRGEPEVWQGEALDTLGMPVGGIGAGQVYLLGDGRLGCWQIFNERYPTGWGAHNYRRRVPDRPIEQAFAVVAERDGRRVVRRLTRDDFPGVSFVGEHPIGRVRYRDPSFPLEVELEAFSPFVPLEVADSTLPATIFELRVHNRGDAPLNAAVLGWLENAVGRPSVGRDLTDLVSQVLADGEEGTVLLHGAEPAKEPEAGGAERPAVLLADFEGENWAGWEASGDAFGERPAAGALEDQQEVTGFLGRGLVNTFRDRDRSEGTLTSPPFVVDRRYLNFLIGGGSQEGRTCVELHVDGRIVRSATGRDDETLTWHTWSVEALHGREARIRIVDRSQRGWGHVNVDHIELADRPRISAAASLSDRPDQGTLALALGGRAADADATRRVIDLLPAPDIRLEPGGVIRHSNLERYAAALLTPAMPLAPGEQRTVSFVVAWHFANLGAAGIEGLRDRSYGVRFPDAAAVARHVLRRRERLVADTRSWHEAYYGGTLPRWLLARLHAPVSNLATGLCYLQDNGRFWAWEGVGCCMGTCTHVWNYAHAMGRLFPALERSVREQQDLGVALEEDGLVRFRGESTRHRFAADGQAGTILKCYREHRMSASDLFLERTWPRIRRALEYLIRADGDEDGVLEGRQHNTFDVDFHGANPFVGFLYLAALRAGEEMALERGDAALATRLRRIFASGSRRVVERLWNGDYFIQDVDLEKHPRHQFGDGCLADQVFGQGWAHQVGLGYLVPRELVVKALESVWKYNWAPDVGPQNEAHPPQRWFARPGEAGLFTCTWPKSPHLGPDSVLYRDEVWTGIEYQVAGHMVREGMLEPALAIVRAVHERYHPRKRNPFNEVECGDHYARALASWGVYLALLGFEHHGPRGHLGFAPRMNAGDFRAAFVTAEGWGTFAQRREGPRQTSTVALIRGRLRLERLTLGREPGRALREVRVTATQAGRARPLVVTSTPEAERVVLALERAIVLAAGDAVAVEIEGAS